MSRNQPKSGSKNKRKKSGAGPARPGPPTRVRTAYPSSEALDALGPLVTVQFNGDAATISNEIRASGIPELTNHHKHLGPESRLIGLIGRDLLKHATLTYRGSKGIVEIDFDLASFTQ